MKKVYLIATFVAIIAGAATFLFASKIEKSTKIVGQDTKMVVVALADIPENTVITAEMVALKEVVVNFVVEGSLSSVADAIDKLNRYPVVKGEQLILGKLFVVGKEKKVVPLSYQLKKDEYAYTIAVDGIQGVSGFISRGDYVDIVYTTAVNGKITSAFLLRNIYVIRSSNFAANEVADSGGAQITTYTDLTLSLTEKQVILMTKSLASGVIKLVLKSITSGGETVETTVEKTTLPG